MKYFQEAMLFFKKSEQEKKVGNWISIKVTQDSLGFYYVVPFWVK